VCRVGGVASVASLIASGPHLAITAPAVAALRLMVYFHTLLLILLKSNLFNIQCNRLLLQ